MLSATVHTANWVRVDALYPDQVYLEVIASYMHDRVPGSVILAILLSMCWWIEGTSRVLYMSHTELLPLSEKHKKLGIVCAVY